MKTQKVFNFRAAPAALIFLISGILSGALLPEAVAYTVLAAAAVISIFSLVSEVKPLKVRPGRKTAFCAAFVCFGVIAALVCGAVADDRTTFVSDVTIEGRISGDTRHDSTGKVLEGSDLILEKVSADGRKLDGKTAIRYFADESIGALKVGDSVFLVGTLSSKAFDVTDGYDMSEYQNRIFYRLAPEKFIGSEDGVPALSDKIKDASRRVLEKNADADTAAFIGAMLFGDKEYLDANIRNGFSIIGAAHIFAVSGLHVGILAGALLWLLKLCRAGRKTKTAVTAAFLAFYAYICGFSPSVLRASLMILTLLISKIVGMRYDDVSAVSLCGCALLLADPYSLFSVGFEMSFIAVFSLCFFSKPLTRVFSKRLPKKFAALLAGDVAVNVGLLPVTLYYFSSVSLLCVPANLIIIPIISLLFPVVAPAILIGAIPGMGWIVAAVAYPFKAVVLFGQWLSGIKFLKIDMEFQWYSSLVYLALSALIGRYCLLEKRAKRALTVVLAVWVLASSALSLSSVAAPAGTCFASHCRGTETDIAVFKEKNAVNAVVSGDIDYMCTSLLGEILSRASITKIDNLITCEVSDYEIEPLADFVSDGRVKTVIARKISNLNAVCDVLWERELDGSDYGCVFAASGVIAYFSDDNSYLFAEPDVRSLTTDASGYDIVFASGLNESKVKHAVKYGELDGKKCNGFTIRLKNGKISRIKYN